MLSFLLTYIVPFGLIVVKTTLAWRIYVALATHDPWSAALNIFFFWALGAASATLNNIVRYIDQLMMQDGLRNATKRERGG